MDSSFFDTWGQVINVLKQPVVIIENLEIVFLNDAAGHLFGKQAQNFPQELMDPVRTGNIPSIATYAPNSGLGDYCLHYVPAGTKTAVILESAPQFSQVEADLYKMSLSVGREFKLPLTMLFSASGLLSDRLGIQADPRIKKYLSVIDQNSYRLLRTVNNIFDIVNYTTGNISLNLRRGDIVSFLKEATDAAAPMAFEMGVSLSFESEPEKVTAFFDADKIERLLYNLISNSLKYTKKGGRIGVRVSASRGKAYLAVNDTGEGIPPEILPYAFRRFSMGEREDIPKGFGLGLGIVRAIARLHGGSVALESRIGEGTKITVMLPLENGEAEILRETGETLDYAGGFSHVLLELSDVLPSEYFIRNAGKIR